MESRFKILDSRFYDIMLLKIITASALLLIIWLGLLFYPGSQAGQPKESLAQKEENEESIISSIQQSKPLFLTATPVPALPLKNFNTPQPQTKTKAAAVFDISTNEILFQKNISHKQPIASLTKLMTALVVLENKSPAATTTVSKKAVDTYGRMGNLVLGEEVTIETLLYALLMESSNDAAVALAEAVSPNFVSLMNEKAKGLEMKDTYFTDPSGLDPSNISTANDLIKLMELVSRNPLIIKILQTPAADLPSADNRYNHHLTNTNRLLEKISGVVGGKTGYLEEAGECLILLAQRPRGAGDIIYIILGVELGQKFIEMEKLINWISEAYVW